MTYRYNENTSEVPLREFFEALYAGVPYDQYMTLNGFNGTKKAKFIESYTVDAIDQMVACVDQHRHDEKTNIYYRMAPLLKRPAPGKRGGEDETAGSGWLWCDLDTYNTNKTTDDAIEALEQFNRPPSFIIHTGRGIQAGWKLREFCTDLEMIKAVNKWIEVQFKDYGADSVGDYARVLRVPTTINHKPDSTGAASIVMWRMDRIYDVEDFGWAKVEPIVFGEPIEAEPLPPTFLQDVRNIGKQGELIYKRMLSEETAKESGAPLTDHGDRVDRSVNDWFITKSLLSLGYTQAQVATVLTHETWFSGSRFRQQKNYDYVNRTIQGASFKLDGNASQYFEVVGHSKTPRFIHSKMYDVIVRSGTRFLRLIGRDDKLLDGIYYHNRGIYRPTGGQFITEEIVARLGKVWAPKYAEDTIKYVRALRDIPTYSIHQAPPHPKLDACVVNTLSGLVQVSTGEVKPHTPDHISFMQIPVQYDPSRGPGVIDAFIREMLPADTVDVFWEFVGYCLLEDCRFKKALHFVGPRDTGKSTIFDLIKRFLGSHNTTAISLQDLVDSKFEKASLLHKFANVYADLSATELKGAGLLKGMVSGDPLTAENKYERSFSFYPTCKHIYSANALVPVADNELDAYVERWIIIPMSKVFRSLPEGEKSDDIHEPDTTMIDTLVSPENLSEMLNLALEGMRRLLKKNRFTYSATVVEEGRKYRATLDSAYAFMIKQTEPDPDGYLIKEDTMHFYRIWCGGDDNRRAVGEPKFFQRMKTLQRELGITEAKESIVRPGETETTRTHIFKGRIWKEDSLFSLHQKREEERKQQNNGQNNGQASMPLSTGILVKKDLGRR